MLLTGLLSTVTAFVVALAITAMVRARALRLGRLEAVNARSSHSVPTPSSGGIGIAAGGSLVGLTIGLFVPTISIPVVVAGLLIALLGWRDDIKPIAPKWRLGAHILLTGIVLALLPPDLLAAAFGLPLPEIAIFVIFVLGGALWINLFNFMDGIDGLAASEAIFLLLAGAALPFMLSPVVISHPLWWWMIGSAAACCGFLVFNWPPAKIFMGDAGSTWLGLMIVFLAAVGLASGWQSLPQWLILPAMFLADALTTLGRRLARREPVHEAHRRHAYQRLALRFGSHRRVTLLYMTVNVVALLPLAILAGTLGAVGWLVVLATYAVLVPAMWWAGAGAPSDPQADEERARSDDRQ